MSVEKICAIYCRVSTEEQAKEGISISAQTDRCKAYCTAKGWNVQKMYVDAGFSAGSTKRPAFQDLLRSAKKGEFNTLLVYKIDRFSRNMKDLILTLEDLKTKNINFSSVTEQIDTTTAMGEAFFQIIGVFAQLERGMVKERVEMAFTKKIDSGEALNRPPYGYMFKSRKMIPDPKTAPNVVDIFDMWANGTNYKEIAKKHELATSTLYDIIKNPVYIGKIRYRDAIYEGSHEPLISQVVFSAINRNKYVDLNNSK